MKDGEEEGHLGSLKRWNQLSLFFLMSFNAQEKKVVEKPEEQTTK
jgi:hypothetical protein